MTSPVTVVRSYIGDVTSDCSEAYIGDVTSDCSE